MEQTHRFSIFAVIATRCCMESRITVLNAGKGYCGERVEMIVITTMDALPDYCYDCPCHNGEDGQCRADANGRYTSDYRPYWCPLKEINNNAR